MRALRRLRRADTLCYDAPFDIESRFFTTSPRFTPDAAFDERHITAAADAAADMMLRYCCC